MDATAWRRDGCDAAATSDADFGFGRVIETWSTRTSTGVDGAGGAEGFCEGELVELPCARVTELEKDRDTDRESVGDELFVGPCDPDAA